MTINKFLYEKVFRITSKTKQFKIQRSASQNTPSFTSRSFVPDQLGYFTYPRLLFFVSKVIKQVDFGPVKYQKWRTALNLRRSGFSIISSIKSLFSLRNSDSVSECSNARTFHCRPFRRRGGHTGLIIIRMFGEIYI
jgi:hypothetical protein